MLATEVSQRIAAWGDPEVDEFAREALALADVPTVARAVVALACRGVPGLPASNYVTSQTLFVDLQSAQRRSQSYRGPHF